MHNAIPIANRPPVNFERLREIVGGQTDAVEVVGFAEEFTVGKSELWVRSFWEGIRGRALLTAPLPPVAPVEPAITPMSDGEARGFEKTEMPFGKHAGKPIAEVPLDYLDWLVGQNEEFNAKLARYMRNGLVQADLAGNCPDDPNQDEE